MFTEYHLEKIIQAINDAEERQTKAIVAAIKSMKEETIVDCTPEKKVEIEIHPDLFEQAFAEAKAAAKIELTEEERFGGKVEPIECPDVLGEEDAVKRMKESFNKARERKKPTSKKPAPVRGRN